MNFTCNKSELSEAINNVSKAVPSKSSIPQLEGIKLSLMGNTLTLTGYDLEMGITTTVNVTNNNASSGEYIINARLFADMVKKMPSDNINIEVTSNDMKAHLKAGNTNCKISVISAKDYPEFPDTSTGDLIELPQQLLKNMIQQTKYAVSISDIKPILTGELFDITENGEFNLVAVDGKRLAIRHENIKCNQNMKFVVPSKTLEELSRILKDDINAKDCRIISTSRHIMFEVDKYTIVSRLLEGEFHNYKASLPKEFSTEVIVKVKELSDCLERCSLLINEKNRAPVKLSFKDSTLKIVCETPLGNIDEEININMTGEPILIGLNNKFLLDAIKSSDCDQVKLLMNSPIKPMTIVPMQLDSFTFLLMPIQLKENSL